MITNPFIVAGQKLPALTNPGAAADLLTGKQLIDADGNALTGTMPTLAAQTITPGTANKTIAAGRYLAGTQTIKGDANLVAANIVKGKSIFGVSGSAETADLSSYLNAFTPSISGDQIYVNLAYYGTSPITSMNDVIAIAISPAYMANTSFASSGALVNAIWTVDSGYVNYLGSNSKMVATFTYNQSTSQLIITPKDSGYVTYLVSGPYWVSMALKT